MGPQVKQFGAKRTSGATEFRIFGSYLCLGLTFRKFKMGYLLSKLYPQIFSSDGLRWYPDTGIFIF